LQLAGQGVDAMAQGHFLQEHPQLPFHDCLHGSVYPLISDSQKHLTTKQTPDIPIILSRNFFFPLSYDNLIWPLDVHNCFFFLQSSLIFSQPLPNSSTHFFSFFYFWDRVSLYRPGWPTTHYVGWT
jgi:hypothetical protein